MFNCTGICKECGRCGNVDEGEILIDISIPEDFEVDNQNSGFGIAFDIGTTTIVAALCNLKTGEIIKIKSGSNPQRNFGGDVVSRTAYAAKGNEFYKRIRTPLLNTINTLIYTLCQEEKVEMDELQEIVFCGNRTMTTFLRNDEISSISSYPFKPDKLDEIKSPWEILVREDNGEYSLKATVDSYIMATIGGNVGGDILAGIISNRLYNNKKNYLFLDLGTNGEVVFSLNNQLYSFSTAAGPAFEGGNIENGMVAREGAISQISIDSSLVYIETIGDVMPKGICGSGLISGISELVKNKIVSEDGHIVDYDYFIRLNPYSSISNHIGENKFILTFKGENNKEIYISQRDIREFQLAKGAIKGGVDLVLKKLKIDESSIDEIILAGGFGKNLNKEALIGSSILPKIEVEKIKFIGNSALSGGIMVLLSQKEKKNSERISNEIINIELANEESFQKLFLDGMSFRY